MKLKFIIIILLLSSVSLFAQNKEEVRAVWVATNYRIDWPSKAFLDSDGINQQQDEFIDLLDKLKKANVNMIFLQTRFKGEVIYQSEIEPMTPYIAGTKNTWSKYDPLDFAIRECRKRGIECHAWFVAYNAGSKEKPSATVENQRHLLLSGEKEYWFDPGNPGTNKYLLSLIQELVEKYDIDGIHLDYLRYPAEASDFPDDRTYQKYGKGKAKGDWRRENINRFVSEVYDSVKQTKPWVQVSASTVPYYKRLSGVSRSHWTAYNDAFQDPQDWMERGKIDFIVPMIYSKENLFNPAVQDWSVRCGDRFFVPGIGAYLLNESERGGDWTLKTVSDQLAYCRDSQVKGVSLYSANYILSNKKGLFDALTKHFRSPALLPEMSWLSKKIPPAPNRPKITRSGDYLYVKWKGLRQPKDNRYYYNVYRSKTSPVDITNPDNLVRSRVDGSAVFIPADNTAYHYVITSYDRYHNESFASPELFYKP